MLDSPWPTLATLLLMCQDVIRCAICQQPTEKMQTHSINFEVLGNMALICTGCFEEGVWEA